MADKRRDPPDLSSAEWEVMNVVWKHGPLAARDVYAHLSGKQDWTYATVKTFLRRIARKGWIEYDQIGNSYLYREAVPRQKAISGAIREFSRRVLDGALGPFVAYFAQQHDLSREDLDQLEEVLRRHRRNEGNSDDAE